MLTSQGDTLRFERDYYLAILSEHIVLDIGTKRNLSSFKELALDKEQAQSKQLITLKVKKRISKSLEIDEVLSLGIGY